MHPFLARLLEKRDIREIDELTSDEKADFTRWDLVLSEGTMSVDKIIEFCKLQLKNIELQWKDITNSKDKNERLIIMHTIYSTLIEIIQAPSAEKENLEKYLLTLLE